MENTQSRTLFTWIMIANIVAFGLGNFYIFNSWIVIDGNRPGYFIVSQNSGISQFLFSASSLISPHYLIHLIPNLLLLFFGLFGTYLAIFKKSSSLDRVLRSSAVVLILYCITRIVMFRVYNGSAVAQVSDYGLHVTTEVFIDIGFALIPTIYLIFSKEPEGKESKKKRLGMISSLILAVGLIVAAAGALLHQVR